MALRMREWQKCKRDLGLLLRYSDNEEDHQHIENNRNSASVTPHRFASDSVIGASDRIDCDTGVDYDSEENTNDNVEVTSSLEDDLRQWALKHTLAHRALNGLMVILSKQGHTSRSWSRPHDLASRSRSRHRDHASRSRSRHRDHASRSRSRRRDLASRSRARRRDLTSRSRSRRRDHSSRSRSRRRDHSSRSRSRRRDHSSRSRSRRREHSSRSGSRRRDHSSRSGSRRRDHASRSRSRPRDHASRSKSRRRDHASRSRSRRRDHASRSLSRPRDLASRSGSRRRDLASRSGSRPRDLASRSGSRPRDLASRFQSGPWDHAFGSRHDDYPLPEIVFQQTVLNLLIGIRYNLKHAQPPSSAVHIERMETMEDFEREEERLDYSETFDTLVLQISRIGGKNTKDFVYKVFDRLFTNALMARFNMKGKGKQGKKPLEMTKVYRAIKDGIMNGDVTATEDLIRTHAAEHLKHAPQRSGGGGHGHTWD